MSDDDLFHVVDTKESHHGLGRLSSRLETDRTTLRNKRDQTAIFGRRLLPSPEFPFPLPFTTEHNTKTRPLTSHKALNVVGNI